MLIPNEFNDDYIGDGNIDEYDDDIDDRNCPYYLCGDGTLNYDYEQCYTDDRNGTSRYNYEQCYAEFSKLHKKFVRNDDMYIFASSYNGWIIVLKKLDNTITNESRTNISVRFCALFRGTNLSVELIFNKYNPSTILDSFMNTDNKIIKVGEIMSCDFDTNLENELGNGFQYYISMEPAYYCGLEYASKKWKINGEYITN